MRLSKTLLPLALSAALLACTTVDDGVSADASGASSSDTVAQATDSGAQSPEDVAAEEDVAAPEDVAPSEDAGPAGENPCEGREEGAPCDDQNACTSEDSCTNGQCVGGTTLVCEGGSQCQSTDCDPEIGCYSTNLSDGTPCSAGCFESASCQAGSCEVDPESAVVCPEPEEPCVDQLSCDPQTGECSVAIMKVEGTACDADENVCTEELCTAEGLCEATGEVNTCAEENAASPCWTWSCASKTGCYQTTFVEGVSCDDNNPCTYSDTCTINEFSQELCVGEALPIDDGNPCTDDACVGGTITHEPIDGISCAVEGCDAPGLCSAGQCEAPEACSCTPVDGGWSEWTVGDCGGGGECDTGEALATRTCTNPAPSCGGAECVGESSEVQPCDLGECADGFWCDAGMCTEQCTPVAGGWSEWVWGPCSVSCGGGVQSGTRSCDNPAPSCNGAMCPGDNQSEQPCNTQPCDDGTFPLGKSIFDTPELVVTRSIPEGVTSMNVSLWGAGGAGGLPGAGGGGAWVHGTIAVSAGDAVELRVGGGGGDDGCGGGASYVFVNDELMLVAAGGGGGGSDGNSGKSAEPGAGSGGGGGALGASGQDGTLNDLYSCGSFGGQGGQQAAGGAGGASNNESSFTSECISPGEAGTMHVGGGTHKGSSCNVAATGGSWHEGGSSKASNGEGAGGGAGYYGGGSGATFWTYAGGGGGGGSSWSHPSVTAAKSEAADGITAGGTTQVDYNGSAGKGGMPGDWSGWPTTTIDPEPGAAGLVVLSL